MGLGLSIPFSKLQRAGAPALPWLRARHFPRHRNSRVALRARFDNAVLREPSFSLLAAKRFVDVAGSMAGLIVSAPLLLAIALAIKLTSPGPMFFRQKRYGYHNRRFWILKFRTMYADLGDQRGTRQMTADDPRVTPILPNVRSKFLSASAT